MLHPGQTFEGYVVDEHLGTGGSGNVYRAHLAGASDAAGGKTHGPEHFVALKILHRDRRSPEELAQLRREFDYAHAVAHPHIVTVYRTGPGWLTMELVEGGTILTLATMKHRLEALVQIGEALDHVHHLGYVHSDVKPANILVYKDFSTYGSVLIDFGVAHSVAVDYGARPKHVQGSLPYAAPELLHGRVPTGATDEYALACTAVELITGKPPFTGTTAMALAQAHLRNAPPRLSHQLAWVPRAFDSILNKAMAKDPEERYQSCGELARLITHALVP